MISVAPLSKALSKNPLPAHKFIRRGASELEHASGWLFKDEKETQSPIGAFSKVTIGVAPEQRKRLQGMNSVVESYVKEEREKKETIFRITLAFKNLVLMSLKCLTIHLV
ncbi:unnamed protein product [Protopolystoma xenopodis]|uniref:Uncharacterized protein n=1 Tax=Protopolystoma xenopodis TaxID=117903 RepID=A0A448XDF2_9PLAT|nr:unnamed protein product [Protopolystoma xenopodis]